MQKKIYVLFLFLILIGIFITGILTVNLVEDNYIKNVEDKLITNTQLVIDLIDRGKIKDYDTFTKETSEITDSRITVIDRQGVVLGDSSADIDNLENHKNRPEIQSAYQGEIGKSKRFSYTLDTDMYYVAISINEDREVVRLAVPLTEIEEFNQKIYIQIFFAAVCGIIFSIILGFRFLRSITQPINELTEATQSIANGKYGEKVYLNTSDEIGYLANNFNKMSEELENKINEINGRNDETKAILSSMINGIIAIDNNKKIMFINDSVIDIFDLSIDVLEVKGKSVLEVFRNSRFHESVNKIIEHPTYEELEIKIMKNDQERTLKVFFNQIVSQKKPKRQIGFVIIIQDISEIRKLENMRKDFVANVSHEIKTPLTSIRGFVETLKNVSVDEKNIRNRFLNIIDIESKRLNTLIDDLLIISDIEKENKSDEHIAIDVNNSLSEIELMLNQLAQKKNIRFKVSIEENLPTIYGNSRWFKQIFINLIDNAIKYTPDGGLVSLKAYAKESYCYFHIEDNGIGIEPEYLDRLFERFYRVDKARSRKIGGTGLGLAIVKHAVNTFNGDVTVKSEVEIGTEFIVKIPI